MESQKKGGWKLGVLAALAVVAVSLIPQVTLWVMRGNDWQGSYAFSDYDELAYSAYLRSIVEGYPRQNNPYLASVNTSTSGETLYSIQFIPPFLIKAISKPLQLSTTTTFILLTPVMAFLSALAIYGFLREVSQSDQLGAVGLLIVLFCGLLVSEYPFTGAQSVSSFAFLRRYIPAVPFPLFFAFCLFIWRAFMGKSRTIVWSIAAGVTFAVLVYSYFYLWTAAAAWLFCFALVCILARPRDRRHVIFCLLIFSAFAVPAIVFFVMMVSQRSQAIDATYALATTHLPDILRITELIGALMLLALAVGVKKKRIAPGNPLTLFAASCGMLPFVVFNQQILTGHSLQPFHYEQFIINYQILAGLVITYRLMCRDIKIRPVLWVLFAVAVGITTGLKSAHATTGLTSVIDSAVPILSKINQDANQNSMTPTVLIDNHLVIAGAPSFFNFAFLWSPHMYTYGSTNANEELERFYQFLYYTGVDQRQLESMLAPVMNRSQNSFWTTFGLHRLNIKLIPNFQPITAGEIRAESDKYHAYTANFSQHQAERWRLSHVVLETRKSYNLANLDRWYVRDKGETIGGWTLYRVHPRSMTE